MTRRILIALVAALAITSCAKRLPIPIQQTWTALLSDDGDRILVSADVHEITPFLFWKIPCRSGAEAVQRVSLSAAAAGCPTVRTFRFKSFDRRARTVLYLEVSR